MDIGTGKVTKREMRGIPHYLLNVATPPKIFTVTQYQKLGRRAIAKIVARKKLPIVVGGTGLYVDALIQSHALPTVPPDSALRKKLGAQSPAMLFAQLQKLDPRRAASIDRHNPRRLVRALEIILTTKRPVPTWEETHGSKSDYDTLTLGVKISEKKLRENIHRRFIARLRHGMVREVARLHENSVSWRRLESFGLEYRYLAQYLQGKLKKPAMTQKLETEIRHYAKRQMTWFKRDKTIHWVKNAMEAERVIRRFLK
jgi:tRNA dimethylallyltransferase